jgi:uncharacterized surface protein with fasciclin (FAS1) repeats
MKRYILAVSVAFVALFGAACGSDEVEPAASGGTTPQQSTSDSMTDSESGPAGELVGPGCDAYAAQVPDGAGSVSGMAKDPVAVAASNNPLLKTLVQAVSGKLNPKVNLVDTLNGDEFTVFAPVDDAFAKVDAATVEKLKADDGLLTTILTYHVVPGQLSPAEVVGEQLTVQGGAVTVSGSGDSLKVNEANVICGGVHTANATVYLIDSVLMPQM